MGKSVVRPVVMEGLGGGPVVIGGSGVGPVEIRSGASPVEMGDLGQPTAP